MKKITNLRIVFMGTPAFAVTSLQALVQADCNIIGVITSPDKPAGRGLQLQQSAVKQYALSQGLNVLQPEKLKNETFIRQLKALQADVQVVVAFRMLPEVVWNMPPMGTINVHGSLLPKYRGAAPINWAIMNGEKETGVTTFALKQEIDTGNILLQKAFAIGENDTAGIVHNTMMHHGAALLLETLQGVVNNTITPVAQGSNNNTVTHAPKLTKETCFINWQQTSAQVHNHIRGLSPYPTAYTMLGNKTLKIFLATPNVTPHPYQAGTKHTDNKTYLKYATTNGYITLLEVQLEGKKQMKIEDMLRGYRN